MKNEKAGRLSAKPAGKLINGISSIVEILSGRKPHRSVPAGEV